MIGRLSSSDNETENTNPFAFTDKYKTDIALIDDEHKHLFEIIEQTNELIHANLLHDKYDEIIHLLNELKTYTETHFSDEEALMEKYLIPDLKLKRKPIPHLWINLYISILMNLTKLTAISRLIFLN